MTPPFWTPNESATAPCRGIHVIGVRGSTEPQSGSRLLKPIGRAIVDGLQGRATYIELEYPATIDRFVPPADIDLGESPSIGVANLVDLLNSSAASQPDRCFVLLGYSQGAQVVGDALVPPSLRICGQEAGELSLAASERIVAVMLFGDPRFTMGEPFNAGTFHPHREGLYPRPSGALARYADGLRNYCAQDDVTCQGRDGTMQGHVAYFSNIMPAEAVDFARERLASMPCRWTGRSPDLLAVRTAQ